MVPSLLIEDRLRTRTRSIHAAPGVLKKKDAFDATCSPLSRNFPSRSVQGLTFAAAAAAAACGNLVPGLVFRDRVRAAARLRLEGLQSSAARDVRDAAGVIRTVATRLTRAEDCSFLSSTPSDLLFLTCCMQSVVTRLLIRLSSTLRPVTGSSPSDSVAV